MLGEVEELKLPCVDRQNNGAPRKQRKSSNWVTTFYEGSNEVSNEGSNEGAVIRNGSAASFNEVAVGAAIVEAAPCAVLGFCNRMAKFRH